MRPVSKSNPERLARRLAGSVVAASMAVTGAVYAQQSPSGSDAQAIELHLARQFVGDALTALGEQSGLNIALPSSVAKDVMAPAIDGRFTPTEALRKILAPTGLHAEYLDRKTVIVVAAAQDRSDPAAAAATSDRGDPTSNSPSTPERADVRPKGTESAQPPAGSEQASDTTLNSPHGIPEVLVRGSNILNMDVKRSRDDAQPYVIFERQAIENSGATSVDEFLKQRLTMNTQGTTGRQAGNAPGDLSEINLRGMGSAQTLILVDGHRVAGLNYYNSARQPDINGIPLSAIERIEVLPTTASGIYGGSATGGVVNIILRRDYSGVETKLTYGSAFREDAFTRRVDVNSGFSLEGGRTHVLFAGSWSKDGELQGQDRDFLERARQTVLDNNSGNFDALTSGFPPLGATTNIRSSTGANLTLKPAFGGANLHSPITFIPAGYAGLATNGVAPLVQNAGKYDVDLAQTYQSAGGAFGDLLSAPTVKSALLTVRRDFTPNWQAFVDASASSNEADRPLAFTTNSFTIAATAPNNPFNQAIVVTVPLDSVRSTLVESKNQRAVVGTIVHLPEDWTAEGDYTWNRASYDNTSTPLSLTTAIKTPIGNGSLDVLRDLNAFPPNLGPYLVPNSIDDSSSGNYVVRDAVVRAAGPLLSLPAGPITLTALLERRREELDAFDRFIYSGTAVTPSFVPERDQTVNSGYLEAQVPFVSRSNAVTGVQSLDMQIAVRRDDYTTTGGTTNVTTTAQNKVHSTDPTVGLRWSPVPDLVLRGSYGKGFLPPSVSQLVPAVPFTVTGGNIVDPRRNNEPVASYTRFSGGSPDLEPEESKSWSAGAILTPRVLSGLRLSVDYTRIDKRNQIGTFASVQEAINDEALFPGVVLRDPPGPGQTVGPITGLNLQLINIARAQVEAYDAQLDFKRDTGLGSVELFALGTWEAHYRTQVAPDLPFLENVGFTSASPLKFKANFGLNWSRGHLSAGWAGRYFDSYLVINPGVVSSTNAASLANQGNGGRVASQMYHDVFASYQWGAGHSLAASHWLSAAEIRLGVQNIFNTRPPVDTADSNGYSAFADPRLASYFVSVRVGL